MPAPLRDFMKAAIGPVFEKMESGVKKFGDALGSPADTLHTFKTAFSDFSTRLKQAKSGHGYNPQQPPVFQQAYFPNAGRGHLFGSLSQQIRTGAFAPSTPRTTPISTAGATPQQATTQPGHQQQQTTPGRRGILGMLGAGLGFTGTAISTSAGAAMSAPGKVLGTVSGLFSKMVSPLGKTIDLFRALILGSALAGTISLFRKFTSDLIESNRSLSKWNGAIAASFARLDIQQMRLDMRTAQATSGTTAELNNQFGQFLQEFQPLREDIGTMTNLIGLSAVNILKALNTGFRELLMGIPDLKEIIDGMHVIEDELKKKNPGNAFPGNQALQGLRGMAAGGPVQPLIPPPRPFIGDPRQELKRRRALPRRMQGG